MKVKTPLKSQLIRPQKDRPVQSTIKKGLADVSHAKPLISLVPELGIEPRRGRPRGILSPVRLPVSPLRHESSFTQDLYRLSIK
jgi:hypothetical protein